MTKVSWKRILQRAGNDLPMSDRSFDDRPRLQAVPLLSGPRPVRMDETPNPVAGELETELRRALQRAKSTPSPEPQPQNQAWDPIFMARELRHTEPVSPVPASLYKHPISTAGSKTTRNIIAASLSALVVGFAIQQIGSQWLDSEGGGGGGGTGGGQTRDAEQPSLSAPLKAKDQSKFVQTGYAIQPLINPSNPTDLSPIDEAPRTKNLIPETKPADATTAFQRDMEEARSLFDRKEEPVAAIPVPARAPAQIAAVTPARVAPAEIVSKQTAPVPSIDSIEEKKLMQRANELLQRGDVTGARLLFEHLASRGSAIGAFALAQSYDQKYLEKLYVRGLTANQKQADFWYRRAAELGGVAANGGSRVGR